MLRDFLDDGQITLENSMALASYLGIDEGLVLENFREYVSKAKKRLLDFAEKVSYFIEKYVGKVKKFFLEMSKADTYYINQGIHRYLIATWKSLEKVTPGVRVELAMKKVQRTFISRDGEIKMDASLKRDPDIEKMAEAADKMKEALDKIEDGPYANAKKILAKEDFAQLSLAKGVIIPFKYSSLASLKNATSKTETELRKTKTALETAANGINDNESVDSKAISATIDLITQQIRRANMQTGVLSAIRRSSSRTNPKLKNTQKYHGKEKNKTKE